MAQAARASRTAARTHTAAHAPAPARARGKGRAPRSRAAAALSASFRLMLLAIVLAGGFGIARVAVTVQAAEAAMDSGRLMDDIKAERLLSDRLEMDKSTLASPSRISEVAGEAMGMSVPDDVRYLDLDTAAAARPAAVAAAPAQASVAGGGFAAVLDTIARVAAEQAQVLLVGDVGLATVR